MSKYGLNKRPTYEQIVNYIESDPVVARYPNRQATIFMNSPQFQDLSNEASIDLQEQNDHVAKQKRKEDLIRERVGTGGTARLFRMATPSQGSDVSHRSDQSEAESDIMMGLGLHGLEREQQRPQAAAMGSASLGRVQRSPEATASAAAASS